MNARFWLAGTVGVLGALSLAPPSWAQDKEETSEAADDAESGESEASDAADEPARSTDEKTSKQDVEEDAAAVADAEKGGSPVEDPGRTYYFVGARYRYIIVPSFMVKLFADGGKTVGVHSFGPEFAIRKDAFEYNFGLWYAAYSMDPTPFKAKDDGPDAWELVESKLKILYVTADFLWSHEITPEFGLNYGMGAGIGFVFGALHRRQAYQDAGGRFLACPYEGFAAWCGRDNDHYGDYEEPSWAGGGSKPILFPWLALQTGLRYKPHRNFAARFDAGFGLSGFFFGVGADYGL